jgi:hypothetical protein
VTLEAVGEQEADGETAAVFADILRRAMPAEVTG